jgi:acetolactate synthase I/III small subunit
MLQDARHRVDHPRGLPPATGRRTLVALVQDRPGVLNRAVSLFRRRGINIEMLTVARTGHEGISCLTCVVEARDVDPVLRQLRKLIEVLDARDADGSQPYDADTLLRQLLSTESQADGVP